MDAFSGRIAQCKHYYQAKSRTDEKEGEVEQKAASVNRYFNISRSALLLLDANRA